MELKYITATQIADEQGLKTAAITTLLVEKGLLTSGNELRKWSLTDKAIALGARYSKNKDGVEYILWPICPEINLLRPNGNLNSINKGKIIEASNKRADTEGELLIKEFFEDAGIRYEFQKPIRQLSHDEKGHRIADFYLPRYDTYVEFFGLWNVNSSFREDYKRKKQVYKQNSISCVFLYPENLGYLHFCFDHRLIEALKQNHKGKELMRYKTWKFMKSCIGNAIGLVLSFVLLFYFQNEGRVIVGITLLYNLYMLIKLGYFIFVKERYNLTRVLYE